MVTKMRNITPGMALLATAVLSAPAFAGSTLYPGSHKLFDHTVQDHPCKHTVQDCLPPFFAEDPNGGGIVIPLPPPADPGRVGAQSMGASPRFLEPL